MALKIEQTSSKQRGAMRVAVMTRGRRSSVRGSSWWRVAMLSEAWLMAWHDKEEAAGGLEVEA